MSSFGEPSTDGETRYNGNDEMGRASAPPEEKADDAEVVAAYTSEGYVSAPAVLWGGRRNVSSAGGANTPASSLPTTSIRKGHANSGGRRVATSFDDDDVAINFTATTPHMSLIRHLGRGAVAVVGGARGGPLGGSATGPSYQGGGIYSTAATMEAAALAGNAFNTNTTISSSSSSSKVGPFSYDSVLSALNSGFEGRYGLARRPRKVIVAASGAVGSATAAAANGRHSRRVVVVDTLGDIDPSVISSADEQMKFAMLLSDPNRGLYESGAAPIPRHLRLKSVKLRRGVYTSAENDEEARGQRGGVSDGDEDDMEGEGAADGAVEREAALVQAHPIQSRVEFCCAAARVTGAVQSNTSSTQSKKKKRFVFLMFLSGDQSPTDMALLTALFQNSQRATNAPSTSTPKLSSGSTLSSNKHAAFTPTSRSELMLGLGSVGIKAAKSSGTTNVPSGNSTVAAARALRLAKQQEKAAATTHANISISNAGEHPAEEEASLSEVLSRDYLCLFCFFSPAVVARAIAAVAAAKEQGIATGSDLESLLSIMMQQMNTNINNNNSKADAEVNGGSLEDAEMRISVSTTPAPPHSPLSLTAAADFEEGRRALDLVLYLEKRLGLDARSLVVGHNGAYGRQGGGFTNNNNSSSPSLLPFMAVLHPSTETIIRRVGSEELLFSSSTSSPSSGSSMSNNTNNTVITNNTNNTVITTIDASVRLAKILSGVVKQHGDTLNISAFGGLKGSYNANDDGGDDFFLVGEEGSAS